MYRYYIGYLDASTGNVGGVDVTRPGPIRDHHDVLQLQSELRQEVNSDTFVVTGFSLYAEGN